MDTLQIGQYKQTVIYPKPESSSRSNMDQPLYAPYTLSRSSKPYTLSPKLLANMHILGEPVRAGIQRDREPTLRVQVHKVSLKGSIKV